MGAALEHRWREAFRAAARHLPEAGLIALRDALDADDPRLLSGAVTRPEVTTKVYATRCRSACPLAFAIWQGLGGQRTAGEVQVRYDSLASALGREGRRLDDLVNWWDRECGLAVGDPARAERATAARAALRAEVADVLNGRLVGAA